MSLTSDEVVLCNQSLDKIGAGVFTYADQTIQEALKCNRHYEQTRDSLLILLEPIFARARAELELYGAGEIVTHLGDAVTHNGETVYTNTIFYEDDFEWDYRYSLPDDFLRLKSIYELDDSSTDISDRFAMEGGFIYTNFDSMSIRYIKQVTDPVDFDPLFTEILILSLALKLINPLAGTENARLKEEMLFEVQTLIRRAKTIYRCQTETSGRSDWNLARYGSGIV